MVLLALLRLVPALRLALMLAYKPGRFDFILRLYHAIVCLSKYTPEVRFGKNVVVWGEDGLRSPSPYFPSRNIPYYYKESDCSINDSNLKVD